MTFDKKLYQLRKEKGLSQETLAEQLNTTRQAISKWENGQGFPDIEKIIMLSNIFGVSIDYLLKDHTLDSERDDGGYYVSKELAQSWLWYESMSSKKIGIGVFFLFSARIPFLLISGESIFRLVFIILLVIIGLGIILAMCLNEKDFEYKQLKRNALVFDNLYIEGLTERYLYKKKQYVYIILLSLAVIIIGALGLFSRSMMKDLTWIIYNVIYTCAIALSFGSLQYCFNMMTAYELLVKNNEYINKFSTRLINMLWSKIDGMFRK